MTAPEGDSSLVLAWYSCEFCGHYWSARLRNGHPQPPADELPSVVAAAAPHEFTGLGCPHCGHAVAQIVRQALHAMAFECPLCRVCWVASAAIGRCLGWPAD